MQKKIPQRQCMGCRERKAKKEMIRVVRGTDAITEKPVKKQKRNLCRHRCKLWRTPMQVSAITYICNSVAPQGVDGIQICRL